MRCPNCGTLIASAHKGCPVCGWAVAPHPLLKRNPKPSAFPTGKRKFAGYCRVCDMTVVRANPFERCPYCGARVHF